MAFAARDFDWESARDFYASASPQATYAEIGERFGIPAGTVGRAASEEDWPNLRKKRQELAVKESGALEMLAEAAKQTHAAAGMAGEVALMIFSGLMSAIQKLEGEDRKPIYIVNVLQTASFCLLNTANACKAIGVVGLPKELANYGRDNGGVDGHGKWDRQLLVQINSTVQGMGAKAEVKAETVSELP